MTSCDRGQVDSSATPEGRALWREQQIRRAGWTGAVSRAAVAGFGIAIAPVLVRLLGPVDFGIYATITSLTAILAFADLGVGQGMVTKMAAASSDATHERRRSLVSSGLAVLLIATAVLVPVSALVSLSLPWGELLDAPSRADELTVTATVFVAILLMAIPSALGVRVLQGLQLGVQVNTWLTALTLTSSTCSIVAALAGAPLRWVVVATVMPNLVLGACFTALALRRNRLWPTVRSVDRSTSLELIRSGFMYLVLNVAASLSYQTGTVIVAAGVGAVAAATFAVTTRAFAVPVQVMLAYNQQLWPAFAEAIAADEPHWVRAQLARSMRRTIRFATALILAGGGALMILAEPLFGEQVAPSASLIAVAGIWSLYQCAVFPIAMLLNALEAVRFQAVTAVIMTTLNVPLALSLVAYVGVEGTIIASLVAHAIVVLGPSLLYLRRRDVL